MKYVTVHIAAIFFALMLLVEPLSGDRSQNLIRNPITPEESNSLFEQNMPRNLNNRQFLSFFEGINEKIREHG